MNVPETPTSAGEFRRGWRPLVATAFGLGLGLSPLPAYTAGIMARVMQKQFGWSRAEILGTLMMSPVALLLGGRHVGRLVDRIGPRRVAIGSTLALGLAQLLIAAIGSSLPLFYLGWAVLIVAGLGTLPLTYAKVINGWFQARRGMALGLALAATGIAGAVFPAWLAWLTAHFGWRGGYVGLGLLPLMIGLPVLHFWLKLPKDAVAGSAPLPLASVDGITVAQALRGRPFWCLAAGSLAISLATGGLMPNLALLLGDRGMAPAAAARALAALALSVAGGRLLSGWLLDRLWGPVVAAILIVPAIVAIGLLASPLAAAGAVITSVITIGLVGGAEFDLVAIMTVRLFGERHFSELYGAQFAIFGIGAGAGPAAFGALHDHFGGYALALRLAMALLAAGVGLFFAVGRYPVARANSGLHH